MGHHLGLSGGWLRPLPHPPLPHGIERLQEQRQGKTLECADLFNTLPQGHQTAIVNRERINKAPLCKNTNIY